MTKNNTTYNIKQKKYKKKFENCKNFTDIVYHRIYKYITDDKE